MQVIERKDNPLLDRVEIRFVWDHPNSSTPKLEEMVSAATKIEPGANSELVFVKDVSTRYGMPRTTGLALIYASEEAASIEPSYIVGRHNKFRGEDGASDEPAKPEEESQSTDEQEEGGDE
ncbi:MAG: 30S ribosomal protein S24e [Euryarchaeota archaeon]|nr:30S ribosomal protein S24e [Euryarchaeota archaeon]MBK70162.1 30S ribosomal protein S24e [Euryarchaeota archaeon]|tara:strand:- start:4818 stop:5180 length:363 start_codon:yes stop_codon:yes gene_type:complete